MDTEQTELPTFSMDRIWEFNVMVKFINNIRFIRNKIACSFF